MPTRKIGDVPKPCRHPEHDPPSHMVFEPGIYEHECPGCGRKFTFTVHGVYMKGHMTDTAGRSIPDGWDYDYRTPNR